MPRKARSKSESGIYHIILRGSNRQVIFHADQDRMKFLKIMAKYKEVSRMKVYGWCLMENHIHLLLHSGDEELGTTMKRIGVSYVSYYNRKYNAIGHLFQDRYKSEVIHNDQYLLTVIRYIHQNPVKAGIVNNCSAWKWSSCTEYYQEMPCEPGLTDTDFILGIFSADKSYAIMEFKRFNEARSEDICLENMDKKRLSDEEAKKEIEQLNLKYEITEIRDLPKEKRNAILRKITEIDGLTRRQAARILGVSPNMLFRL